MGSSICSCNRKANSQPVDGECNLDRSSALSIKINSFKYDEEPSTTENTKLQMIEDKAKNMNLDKISQFNDGGSTINVDEVDKDENRNNAIIDNDSMIKYENDVEKTESDYDVKYVVRIQRFFRKFKEVKVKSQNLYRTRGSLISFAQKDTKSKVSYNSLRSSQLGEMDDRIKDIINQLKKPYKLKCSKNTGGKEGFCIQEWEDGSVLKGMFKNNKLNGPAEVTTSDGKFIEGEFVDNKVNGFARLINSSGTLYEGSWIEGNINGLCRESWQDGTIFQGEYKAGRRNGLGIYRLPDGTFYEGNFVNDSLSGWGIMYFSNENCYSGEWKEDKMHGYGEYLWPNGRVYVGMWEKDAKHGFGIHYWAQPEKAFIGFWINNKQHGLGCVITSKLIKYGTWEQGERKKWLKDHDARQLILQSHAVIYQSFFPKDLGEANSLLKSMK